jgi:hypothetical protein
MGKGLFLRCPLSIVVGAYGIRPATRVDNAPFAAHVGDVNVCNASIGNGVAENGVGMENGVGVSHTPLHLTPKTTWHAFCYISWYEQ